MLALTKWTFLPVAALLLAGCEQSAVDLQAPGFVAETTTTTMVAKPPIDVSVIPADPKDITPEYVEAVLSTAYEVLAEAISMSVSADRVTARSAQLVRRVFGEEEANDVIESLERALKERIFPYETPVRAPRVRVLSTLTASGNCIFVHATFDYSRTSRDGGRDLRTFITLRPTRLENAALVWQISDSGTGSRGTQPDNPCK